MAIFKETDSGLKVANICRKHGISQPAYSNWKSKNGGIGVSQLKRVKEFEAGHANAQAHVC